MRKLDGCRLASMALGGVLGIAACAAFLPNWPAMALVWLFVLGLGLGMGGE